tara:strand:+ start:3975 stop:4367 length:393 start_codon:yes stop_codon:yes gene_type:complete
MSANAPHLPYNVPKRYENFNIPEFQNIFYVMITNVDDNFTKLQNKLKEFQILDNTIVVFMTDKGTASGYKDVDRMIYGFNAGMKGVKNSEYEGGHRVPFFIYYPNGNLTGERDVETLTSHIDVMPTLASL